MIDAKERAELIASVKERYTSFELTWQEADVFLARYGIGFAARRDYFHNHPRVRTGKDL